MQRTQLVQYAAKRPDVTFFIVLLLVDLLRAHVVWSTHMRECELRLVRHDTSEAEVTELHVRVGIEEDVARFEVTMQNFLWFRAF